MLARMAGGCLCAIVIGSAGLATAGQDRIPEPDRYIKLGTRLPDLPPDESGELRVVADQRWCRDATYMLEVRQYTEHESRPAVRLIAGPSQCGWTFERMPEGTYDALILTQSEEILAVGRARLSRGSIALITAESGQTEIEGWITSQKPLPSPLRLKFMTGSNPWTASVAADGSYRVRLGDIDERTRLWIFAEADGAPGSEPTQAMNMFELTTTTISQGLMRLDFEDVKLPPVVLHLEVPPVSDARFDEFATLSLDGGRGAAFKLLRGFRGQLLTDYGDHEVAVSTYDGRQVLAKASVKVAPKETEARVVVPIARR
jgi:hypothetical protein